MLNKFTYFFKRKYRQIRNLIRWTPVIWKQFDFDYCYAIEAFSFQLENIAKRLESDVVITKSANNNAKRIRTALRLMKKVYDGEYSHEYQDKLVEIYGKELMEFNIKDRFLKRNYELTESREKIEEIEEVTQRLFKESQEKQAKAHRILWAFIEHNIQHWWD